MPNPDQVQAGNGEGQSQEKVLSMDERIDKGFEEVELITAQENAAKAKAKGDQPPAGEKKKEPGESTQKPFKVLKVGGKEIPVNSEEELIELAQKGADYTKKTQALAEDRRDAEAKVKAETDKLDSAYGKMEELANRLIAAKVLPADFAEAKGTEGGEGAVSAELAKVYKEFQLDPATAYPHEKRQVEEIHALRKAVKEIQDNQLAERAERAEQVIQGTIEKEKETHPFENILDDQGNDVTRDKIRDIVATKRAIAGVEKPDVKQTIAWIQEAVRDIHAAQKGKNGGETVSDDMDPEEFAKKFPSLAKKMRESTLQKDKTERDKLPPTLKPAMREIDAMKRPGQKAVKEGAKTVEQILDEGFKDPDVMKALGLTGE